MKYKRLHVWPVEAQREAQPYRAGMNLVLCNTAREQAVTAAASAAAASGQSDKAVAAAAAAAAAASSGDKDGSSVAAVAAAAAAFQGMLQPLITLKSF